MEYGVPSEGGPYSPRGTTTPPLEEDGMRRKFFDLACRRLGLNAALPALPNAEVKLSVRRTLQALRRVLPPELADRYPHQLSGGQLQRVAKLMSSASLAPAHLRGEGKLGDCFLVAAQAFRWRMDPFSVAQHTYVLSGKLGYEGKLIAAIVNASGKLQGSLDYRYSGSGDQRSVTVSGNPANIGDRVIVPFQTLRPSPEVAPRRLGCCSCR